MRGSTLFTDVTGWFGRIRSRFTSDRSGAAAIEFALVMPLLLVMYFATMEVSQGIETHKKLGRVASTVGDLITRQREMTPGDLQAIMGIGKAILTPYGRSKPTITATGIRIVSGNATVVWSQRLTDDRFGAGVAANTTTTVPAKLLESDKFLVRVTAEMNYRPMLTWSASSGSDVSGLGLLGRIFNDNGGLQMDEIYYMMPRQTAEILCTDCRS